MLAKRFISTFLFVPVQYGMTELEQREMLTQFFGNNFARQHTGEILKSILNEYTHYKASGQDPQEFGRMTREILSDAITVGPLLQMAKIHAEAKRATYAYVFHRSRNSRRGDQVTKPFLPSCGGYALSSGVENFPLPKTSCP